MLAACGGGDDDSAATNAAAPSGNQAPQISGSPASTMVLQDTAFSFKPEAQDPDGDVLTFRINQRPTWATFSAATGQLQGTPRAADLGAYGNIVISVTDGEAESSLDPFNITVTPVTNGAATLSWQPPTQNTDGTPLTDLAGFKIYWGTAPGEYPHSLTVENPGITAYVVENLVPATYYFVATALNTGGAESEASNMATGNVL